MESQDYKIELRNTHKTGQGYIGKTAQSTLLTELSATGKKVISAPQKITAYEVVDMFGEPTLMVTISGESVLERTIFNVN